jgi:5-hydroxytryptamine receptor 1
MTGRWTLGLHVCELWITSDVFCCTASILNIVVIALDRYWLITRNVRYTHSTLLPRRTVCGLMLTAAWLVSALIASSPLLGWRTGRERDDPSVCLISQDFAYTVFSTFGAFWFPLPVILVVYVKIFRFARLRALRHQVPASRHQAPASRPAPNKPALAVSESCVDTTITVPVYRSTVYRQDTPSSVVDTSVGVDLLPSPRLPAILDTAHTDQLECQLQTGATATRMRKCRSLRMRRSARTLGLVIGGFVVCWLPFFVVATVVPFCQQACRVPPGVNSMVLWLGYSNSLFNPAIYAIWDRSFRRSFKRICTCGTTR